MKRGLLCILVSVGIFCWVPLALGAKGDECFSCHERLAFEGRVVHSPVQEGRCGVCHSPHVSKHKGLLKDVEARLCFSCHGDIEKSLGKSSFLHDPVSRGDCVICHSPHASSDRGLLSEALAQSCFSCHPESRQVYAKPHAPYAKGQCTACHAPHGAEDSRLVKKADPQLCLGCHTDRQKLKVRHLGRDADTMACLNCHAPHGGDGKGLLRKVQHAPFASGDCRQCHDRPNSPTMCLQCHEKTLKTFQGTHSHLLGQKEENVCLACHDAHAGDGRGLLPANQGRVCRSCHADTFSRRAKMLHRHPQWTRCSECHQLHGSDQPAMLKTNPDSVCGQCHEKHVSFTHPIGDRARDPRNGLPMNCISCHESNVGSLFKYHLRGGGERGLCVECHQSY